MIALQRHMSTNAISLIASDAKIVKKIFYGSGLLSEFLLIKEVEESETIWDIRYADMKKPSGDSGMTEK